MKNKITFLLLTFILFVGNIYSQNASRTFGTGSYIIDMGQNSTIAVGLKPYGLVYTLLRTNNVPVYWSINSSKTKDGIDFTFNAKNYRGGTFIISAEDATGLGALIATWRTAGVVIDGPTASSFSAPIYKKLTS